MLEEGSIEIIACNTKNNYKGRITIPSQPYIQEIGGQLTLQRIPDMQICRHPVKIQNMPEEAGTLAGDDSLRWCPQLSTQLLGGWARCSRASYHSLGLLVDLMVLWHISIRAVHILLCSGGYFFMNM